MVPATPPHEDHLDPDGDSVLNDSPSLSSSRSPALPAPSGPFCTYGPRLAYTYFKSPAPRPEQLNAGSPGGGGGSGGRVDEPQSENHWFTVDDQLLYLSFFQDSGPLNAACLYRFCLHVHTLLEDETLKGKRIVLYSSDESDKKANSALLMALYAMIVLRWSTADVLHPIAALEIQPFRDAGYARADYHLSLQSCIYGIHRAISLHLLDLSTFDLKAYELYEKVEQGDWNWITPGFLAFASPVEPGFVNGTERTIEGGTPRLSHSFRNVLDEFEKGGVRVVVRLNKKLYDKTHFTDRGMEHIDMYFDDGTNPTLEMTREFIDLSDRVISAGGVVAVHCKAGLGRTGTLIGAYLIYKHGFTASEAIGFMRLMRPGSCVGPQQHYLYENQMTWIRWGAIDSLSPRSPLALDRPITPPNELLLSHSRSRQTTPTAPTPSAAAPPRTPGRVVAVPGQPRKTPGKSKHSVATPETVDVDPTPLAQDDDFDILDTLPRIASTSTLKKQPPPSPTKAAPVTGGRPTRIARARTRPLSAIADNRIVELLSTTSEMRRARSVKDLGTLFEAPPVEGEEEEEEEESGGGRYELRGSGSGRSTPIGGRAPIASPSRLPTRVPAKRRGAAGVVGSTNRVRERALTSAPGTAGGAISYLLEGAITGAVGRKVRRRRSSLGSTDFVQSV